MVERELPKLEVAGSTPVVRFPCTWRAEETDSVPRMPQIAWTIVVAAVLVLPGASAGAATLPPVPEELPANTVAVVSGVPVSLGKITKAELQRGLVEMSAAAGRKTAPKSGGRGYEQFRDESFGERLDIVWIEGQAALMGIDVSARRVARELERIKEQSFDSGIEYQRYLREAHFTLRDVNERVRLQMLTDLIQERVMRRAGSFAAGVEAFQKFVDAYAERWRARTVCAPEYVTDRCSNGPLPS